MTDSPDGPGARLLRWWNRLSSLPGGRRLFSVALGAWVPYSGSMGARVEVLEAGFARVSLRDRRAVRNHLRSVHAVALTNLGELAGGLALVTSLPPEVRSIVTRLDTRFHRKARGRLVAEGRAPGGPLPEGDEETERDVQAEIRDASGELVAEVRATWRLRR